MNFIAMRTVARRLCLPLLLAASGVGAQEFEPPKHRASYEAGQSMWTFYGDMQNYQPGTSGFHLTCAAAAISLAVLHERHDAVLKQLARDLAEDDHWQDVVAANEARSAALKAIEQRREAFESRRDDPRIEQALQDAYDTHRRALAQAREMEKRLYLTEIGRDRANLEAFTGWMSGWAYGLRSTCGPSQAEWATEENEKAVQAMTSDVQDMGDFYVGWYEAFKASSVFAGHARAVRGWLLGDEDFGDTAAQERKRAQAQARCAEIVAAWEEAEARDTEWYGNEAEVQHCIERQRGAFGT